MLAAERAGHGPAGHLGLGVDRDQRADIAQGDQQVAHLQHREGRRELRRDQFDVVEVRRIEGLAARRQQPGQRAHGEQDRDLVENLAVGRDLQDGVLIEPGLEARQLGHALGPVVQGRHPDRAVLGHGHRMMRVARELPHHPRILVELHQPAAEREQLALEVQQQAAVRVEMRAVPGEDGVVGRELDVSRVLAEDLAELGAPLMDDAALQVDQVGHELLAVIVRDEGEPRCRRRAVGGHHPAFGMRGVEGKVVGFGEVAGGSDHRVGQRAELVVGWQLPAAGSIAIAERQHEQTQHEADAGNSVHDLLRRGQCAGVEASRARRGVRRPRLCDRCLCQLAARQRPFAQDATAGPWVWQIRQAI